MQNVWCSRNSFFLGALVIGTPIVASFVNLRHLGRQFFFQIHSKKCKQLIYSKGLKIFLIESNDDWVKIPTSFFKSVETSKIVGLDCEWVSRDKKEAVALIQISSHSGECVLVRLCKVQRILPEIQEIPENDEILKVGVEILGDAHRVTRDFKVSVCGCLDLRHLVFNHQYEEILKKKMGLAGLSTELLGITIEKDLQIRCSDWEALRLTNGQIDYASLDSFLSIPIFCELINNLYQLSIKTRLFPVTTSESWAFAREIVKPYLDKHFKAGPYLKIEEKSIAIGSKVSYKVTPLNPDKNNFQPRKAPLYLNCYIEAPDGEKLGTCDYEKADWYLNKGMAEQVREDPFTVRLKFEPSGRPVGDCDKFYLTPKNNCCVVCGEKESLVRKNVIPQEYRKHFPDIMKNHQSHDILLLCGACHRISHTSNLALHTQLAEECNTPIRTVDTVRETDDFLLKKVRSAAKAIESARDKIPLERLAELEAIITEYYSVSSLTDDVLKKAL